MIKAKWRRCSFVLAMLAASTCATQSQPSLATSATQSLPPLPNEALWESHMLDRGRAICEAAKAAVTAWKNGTGKIDACMSYYDGQGVNLGIYEYTKDPYWKDCADVVRSCYRGMPPPAGTPLPNGTYGYVFGNGGSVPGYWGFSDGFLADFQKYGDTNSKAATFLLSEKMAYSTEGTPIGWTAGAGRSREVAYGIRNMVHAETMGHAHRTRQDQFVEQAFGHIEQWVSGSYRLPNPYATVPAWSGYYYFQPFMGGLTMRALITLYDATSDPALKQRIYDQVKRLMTFINTKAWDPNTHAWWYENAAPTMEALAPKAGAPDLNMLILPAMGWLYSIDHDQAWITFADQAFDGGATGAYLLDDKHFNQNYTWSLDYVKWRGR